MKRVSTSVGPEQEYFLVDEEKYKQRKDLIFTGRTLFGAMPPKGQEMDDHYFGSIRQRISAYMKEVNEECWKLGIPAKTQHNEVAPAQHELAPIYAPVNIAADQNQMMMRILKKVASRHGMRCVLHEKPFAGVNGSGKHNNWSLTTDDGINLLDPGKTPHENIQFLLVLTCILKAVDEPPAVISVFLGEQLEDVLEQLVSTGTATHSKKGSKLETGVKTLPDFMKDATDRNRTSPFAFTGNKFEFRMVGSRDSISACNVVLNTITAEVFKEVCDRLEKAPDFELAVHDLIKEYATDHQKIVFNGNGYAPEWEKEAKRRGLPILPSMVDAIPALTTEKAVKLFESFDVFSRAELESRAEIKYEIYSKAINIEAKTMIDMATKQIIPAVIKYTTVLGESINTVKTAGEGLIDVSVQLDLLKKASKLLKAANSAMSKLSKLVEKTPEYAEGRDRAVFCREKVVPAMEALREPVDELEMIVDKEMWPMPSYGDLVFEV